MFVYIINREGQPLMPCKPQKARKLLKEGKATVVKHGPFTLQLNYGSAGYRQLIRKVVGFIERRGVDS